MTLTCAILIIPAKKLCHAQYNGKVDDADQCHTQWVTQKVVTQWFVIRT